MNELDDLLSGGTAHGQETSYDCPLCVTRGHSPDTSEKLWVNYSKSLPGTKVSGVYFCYRCEAKGSVEFLLRWLGADPEARPVHDEYNRLLRILLGTERPQEAASAAAAPVDYTQELIESGCKPIAPGSDCYTYLVDRGVAEEDIAFYRMLSGRGRYHHRVIVPTFAVDRTIPFFVARSIKQLFFDIPGKGRIEAPKYLNPKGEGRKWSLFNLFNAAQYNEVVLTEGVFSSIAAGRNAIASFGKLVTNTQLDLIKRHASNREVIVCFDGDAHAQCVNVASRLSQMGIRTSFVLLPNEHDPATLPGVELQHLLHNRHPYSESVVLRLQAEGSFKWLTQTTQKELGGTSLRAQYDSLTRSLRMV